MSHYGNQIAQTWPAKRRYTYILYNFYEISCSTLGVPAYHHHTYTYVCISFLSKKFVEVFWENSKGQRDREKKMKDKEIEIKCKAQGNK